MGIVLLCGILAIQGCFDPVYPQLDRESRIMEAIAIRDTRALPPSPLTPAQAVVYALANNLDAKVAEIETAYFNEAAIAARRRLLPSLTLRYSMDHSNHPSARWSESTRTGSQSLESSYSSDPNHRQGEVGMMWNLIDFGVGYLRSRQQGERIRHSEQQQRRVKQQVVLDVLSHYWRASAAMTIARDAEAIRKELDEQAVAIRDSVEMRILSGAEGARRELVVHGGLAELEQWRRAAAQAKLELGRVMGCGSSLDFELAAFPDAPPELPPLPGGDPSHLQSAALQRRPELFQQDVQERIAVDEARIALLQMAPNANLSLSVYDDPDKFLEWSNWMTVGARVSWNLFSIPARMAERRMAKLQGDTARKKGLATAAAIMAQVGIAYSEWRLSHEYAKTLAERAAARQRLVDALAAGEKDGQTRPGEVLQERVRLLSERAASLRANAEARVAGARLANAIGIDVDHYGRLVWKLGSDDGVDMLDPSGVLAPVREFDRIARAVMPDELSGLTVVKAETFMEVDDYYYRGGHEAGGEWQRTETPPKQPAPDDRPDEPEQPRQPDAQQQPQPEQRQQKPEDQQAPPSGKPARYARERDYDPYDREYDRRDARERGWSEEYYEEHYPRRPAAMRDWQDEYDDGRGRTRVYEEDFDPEVMRDLARTSYDEDVSATRLTERSPVRIVLPKLLAKQPANRVDLPEELQAQAAPFADEYGESAALPMTSFVGPETWNQRGAPPAAPSSFDDSPSEVPLRPIELPEEPPLAIPEIPAEPIAPIAPEAPEASVAPSMETQEPEANVGRPLAPPTSGGKAPLRPPSDGKAYLKPPVTVPSPNDFGSDEVFRL